MVQVNLLIRAPPLYLAHAAITFFSGYLTSLFDIHLGYTFSSSLIDLGLGYFNQKNMSLLFLVVGPIIAITYFVVFYWAIGFFNFKTPGREEEVQDEESAETSPSKPQLKEKAMGVLTAIGGSANIKTLDACITRLRLTLNDDNKLDQTQLKRLGAAGVMKAGGGNVQIVFGVESDFLKTEIETLMKSGVQASIISPLSGKIIPLSEIPDTTFNQEIMGRTIGILPSSNTVVAPFDGEVATLFHTHHAIGLLSQDGIELLIHVGIDTVKMNGEGFKAFVKDGDKITKGQKLIEFDMNLITAKATSLVTPIVITNPEHLKNLKNTNPPLTTIKTGDTLWNYN